MNSISPLKTIALFATLIGTGLIAPLYFPEFSLTARWLVIIGILISYVVMLGGSLNGRPDGILIDVRKKISLSRFQMSLWTLLIVSALLAIVFDRTIPILDGSMTPAIGPFIASNPSKYGDGAINPLNLQFPQELIIALGISTASLAGSSLIKRNKSNSVPQRNRALIAVQNLENTARNNLSELNQQIDAGKQGLANLQLKLNQRQDDLADPMIAPSENQLLQRSINLVKQQQQQAHREIARLQREKTVFSNSLSAIERNRRHSSGILHVNPEMKDAGWSDLIQREEMDDPSVIDFGKLQMLFFTLSLFTTYAVYIYAILHDPNLVRAETFQFPAFTSTMNGLLGLSNAGYLAVKSAN